MAFPKSRPRLFSFLAPLGLLVLAAHADTVDDLGARLQTMLAAPNQMKSSQESVDAAVSLIRNLNTLSVTTDKTTLSKSITVLIVARVTPSIGNAVSNEAAITLSGIGYSEEALKGYVTALTSGDPKVRKFAAQILDTRTSTDRTVVERIGLDQVLSVFVEEARNSGLSYPDLWNIVSAPVLANVTASARLDACVSALCSQALRSTLRVQGPEIKSQVLKQLQSGIGGYTHFLVLAGGNRFDPRLGPFAAKCVNLTDLLIRRHDNSPAGDWGYSNDPGYPNSQTTWTEVATFEPAARQDLTDRLVVVLAKELETMVRIGSPAGGPEIGIPLQIINFIPTLGKPDATKLIPQLQLNYSAYGTGVVQQAGNIVSLINKMP